MYVILQLIHADLNYGSDLLHITEEQNLSKAAEKWYFMHASNTVSHLRHCNSYCEILIHSTALVTPKTLQKN